MIEARAIEPLVDVADQLPQTGQLALLDALTHLPLSADAWAGAAPLAHAAMSALDVGLDPQAIDVLAHVPLMSVRQALRKRAWRVGDAVGRQCALSLAALHDDAGADALMREFRRAPGVDVVEALACVLHPGLGVVADDLLAGLQSADEEVRLWAAIAVARVGRRPGTDKPDFRPLDELWRATAAAPGAVPASAHFDGPPAFLRGAPAWAASRLAKVRPLPAEAHEHVLALKQRDFDGWMPRDPSLVQDNGAVRALLAGLTGLFDVEGEPIDPHPEDTGAQRATDPAIAAALEGELEGLALHAASGPTEPSWVLGNRVLDIGLQFLPGTWLPIDKVLRNTRITQYLPRQQLAWTLGRIGPQALIDDFALMLRSPLEFDRFESVQWLRDIAVEVGTPAPYGGASGRDVALPQTELIDDLPHVAAFVRKGAPPGDELWTTGLDVASAPHIARDTSLGLPPASPAPDAAPMDFMEDLLGGPPTEPGFHFVLDGDKARGDAMCAHSQAALEFRFAPPPREVLAVVDSADLDAARQDNVDILLELTGFGSMSLPGSRLGVAKFVNGAMVAPVRFVLASGAVDERRSGVSVSFIVRGETVHQMDIPIAVVADADALARRAQARAAGASLGLELLADAASASPALPQRMRMTVELDAEGLCIELVHSSGESLKMHGPFKDPTISDARLQQLVGALHRDLAGCYVSKMWTTFDGTLRDDADGAVARVELELVRSIVAAAGSRLNKDLRENNSPLAQALDLIDALPDGSTLTISTRSVYLPWEIFYPRRWHPDFSPVQRKEFPLDPHLFWGARFAIETTQSGYEHRLADLRKRHRAHPPKVSVNLNRSIVVKDVPATAQPIAVQQAWAQTLDKQGRLESVHARCEEIRPMLQDATTAATLVYVYCHGSALKPFGGSDEWLDLDSDCDCKLTPGLLAGSKPFEGAPIVFLNACESADHSPLAFSSFLSEFRRREALGMIAASFKVPIVFAAHFGAEVAQCVLDRSGSLAAALHGLRRRHLLDNGNPVPLFYALQCQITFPPTPGGLP